MHRELLIGGQKYGGACDQGIGKTQHYAPYDGKLVGTAAEAGWSEVDAALDAADEAFVSWKHSPRHQRQSILRNVAALVRERHQELSELLAVEVGKPITLAEGEVTRLHRTFDLAADLLSAETGRLIPVDTDDRGPGYRCIVERFPVGVVLGIVPYNWPFNLAAHKLAPALAAGNTVVLKTPSIGTLSTLTLGHLLHEAGAPDGVVNVVNCPAVLAEKAALDDRVAMLSFTGSPKVGWSLKEKLPRKKVSLELGGDATCVIAPDADLEDAVTKLIPGAFGYAGQICISVQHLLVHADVYEEFKDRFIKATEECPTGDPLDRDVVCGPLARADDCDKVLEWIDEAEQAGATVLCGGQRSGQVIEPCIVENVDRSMRLGCQEVFGPVVTLQPYSDDRDAIDWINASDYGIHASVFTQDMRRAEQYFQQVEVGGVIVGDSPSLRFDAMPYGGVKESGFGREGVKNTFEEMTEPKVMLSKVGTPDG